MLHIPHHGCVILLIERIVRVNEEVPPVLLLVVLLPQMPHRMDTSLYSRLQATAEMFRPAGLLGLLRRHHQLTLRQYPPPRFPHAY